jgi:hypothetical protein
MSIDNFDKDIQDVQQGANPEQVDQIETTIQTNQDAEPEIDYKVKFAESAKEAQRLYHENEELKKLQAEESVGNPQTVENLYPGFEDLDADAQANLLAYTNAITGKAKDEIYKDPAIAFARKQFNESKWNGAFDSVTSKYPELANSKEEFKQKYFNANNVPENIDSILDDVAKIYLFDKARLMGAEDERTRQERVDLERSTGGDRVAKSTRSIEDWQRMAESNPAEFAKHAKEYHADLESGKL